MGYRRPKPANPHKPYMVDACGECRRGTCDRCEFCLWIEALPGSRVPHMVYPAPPLNAIGGPQTVMPRGVSR